MSSIDADVQLIRTNTANEVRYHQPSSYTAKQFFPPSGGTITMGGLEVPPIVADYSEKVLASVRGIVRDYNAESVHVDLDFTDKTMMVVMPRSLFARLEDFYVGLRIEYRIIRDPFGVRKQEIIRDSMPVSLTEKGKQLRNKIKNLLDV